MIKPISRDDLLICIEILHRGYETVAIEFALTEENSPDRGRASLPLEKLVAEFNAGAFMFGYYYNDCMVGYLGMKKLENGDIGLDDIVVLPEYRKNGYGTELLNFCKQTAKDLGAKKVRLGMIDDNKRLRKWYEENGFATIRYIQYDNAPYTVGKMECQV